MVSRDIPSLTVSVVIPNYNYGRFLAQAVESVFAQTYPCLEVIVVDDGSTDDSLEILAQYRDRVTILRQKNRGVGVARNAGAGAASGDLLAFLDADDYWLPAKIERQIPHFELDPEVGLVTCGMEEFSADGTIIGTYLKGKNGWCAHDLLRFESVVGGPGSTTLVRKRVFDKVGGYDPRKELHPSEDWELSYRLAVECKLAFVPDVLVMYRNHGDNGHLKIPRMEHAMRLAFDELYSKASPEVRRFKGHSYGNLYTALAGSYFHAGNYFDFGRTLVNSLRYRPSALMRYLQFPLRVLRRRVLGPRP